MDVHEFLVPGKPASVHERDRKAYRAYQDSVFIAGARVWPGNLPFVQDYAKMTIIVLCAEKGQPDVDNVIKPIMDALEPLYYATDAMISHVEARRVNWPEHRVEDVRLPDLLKSSWIEGRECVYVRLEPASKPEHVS